MVQEFIILAFVKNITHEALYLTATAYCIQFIVPSTSRHMDFLRVSVNLPSHSVVVSSGIFVIDPGIHTLSIFTSYLLYIEA